MFARAGRWLALNLGPGESIAIRPAGVIAYLVDAPALDLLGLNDRAIARDPTFRVRGPAGHQLRVPTSYVRDRGITYLIGHPRFRPAPGEEGKFVSIEMRPGEYLIFEPLGPNAKFQPRVYRRHEHAGALRGWRPPGAEQ